jgi:hypothetical protein
MGGSTKAHLQLEPASWVTLNEDYYVPLDEEHHARIPSTRDERGAEPVNYPHVSGHPTGYTPKGKAGTTIGPKGQPEAQKPGFSGSMLDRIKQKQQAKSEAKPEGATPPSAEPKPTPTPAPKPPAAPVPPPKAPTPPPHKPEPEAKEPPKAKEADLSPEEIEAKTMEGKQVYFKKPNGEPAQVELRLLVHPTPPDQNKKYSMVRAQKWKDPKDQSQGKIPFLTPVPTESLFRDKECTEPLVHVSGGSDDIASKRRK